MALPQSLLQLLHQHHCIYSYSYPYSYPYPYPCIYSHSYPYSYSYSYPYPYSYSYSYPYSSSPPVWGGAELSPLRWPMCRYNHLTRHMLSRWHPKALALHR